MERGVLRRLLTDAFSESELKDLYFDLDVDDEALPGISKPDKVLDALEALHDDLRRVRTRLRWAGLASQTGNFSAATQRLKQGLEIACRLGEQSAEADILQILGVTATRQADYPTARAKLQQGMALAQALNDVKKTGRMLANLGIVAWYQADYAETQACYEQSLAIDQATGNRRFESYTLGNRRRAEEELGCGRPRRRIF